MSTRQQEQPAELFHYTGSEGLTGILESGELHATHAAFSNDTREILEGTELLKKSAARFLSSIDGCGEPMQPTLQLLIDGVVETLTEALSKHAPFLFCLSAKGDQLSQWRAYGREGVGYSIGFSTAELVDSTRGSLVDVTYDNDAKTDKLDRIVDTGGAEFQAAAPAIFEKIKTATSSTDRMEAADSLKVLVSSAAASMGAPLVQAVCGFKDSAFSEEVESRMVAFQGDSKLNFRNRAGLVVPYLALRRAEKRQLPVTRVIVGPHRYPAEAQRGVQLLLTALEYPASVELSKVPFRRL